MFGELKRKKEVLDFIKRMRQEGDVMSANCIGSYNVVAYVPMGNWCYQVCAAYDGRIFVRDFGGNCEAFGYKRTAWNLLSLEEKAKFQETVCGNKPDLSTGALDAAYGRWLREPQNVINNFINAVK